MVVASAPGLILKWVVHGRFHKNLDHFCNFCLLNPYCLQVVLQTVQGFTSENQTATCAAAASQLRTPPPPLHLCNTSASKQEESFVLHSIIKCNKRMPNIPQQSVFLYSKNIGTTLHLVKIKEMIYSNQQVLGHAWIDCKARTVMLHSLLLKKCRIFAFNHRN